MAQKHLSPTRRPSHPIAPANRQFFSKDDKNIDPELKRSHLLLHSIIENIPNMIFVKSADDLRFVRFNRAGEALLGYKRNELIGKNDYDFFTKGEADFFTLKDRQVLANGILHDIPEEPIHTRHKGMRILHTKKIPIFDEKGKAQYLLGISEDITDQKILERAVTDISEREQRRIGQDLHDGLGQHLTGIALLSKVLAKRLEAAGRKEAKAAKQISDLVNQAIAHTRDLSHMLYPLELQTNGLMSALQELASSTRKVFRHPCTFVCEHPLRNLNKSDAGHLYRIAQEAIDNAMKHSRAKRLWITLEREGHFTTLRIDDNGQGFSRGSRNKRGMGLAIMSYRAKMIGGTLQIEKSPHGGAAVVCRFLTPPADMNVHEKKH